MEGVHAADRAPRTFAILGHEKDPKNDLGGET